jgi:hypothetical protein
MSVSPDPWAGALTRALYTLCTLTDPFQYAQQVLGDVDQSEQAHVAYSKLY